MILSPFSSYCFSASYPSFAFEPSASVVPSPNSSLPSLIIASPFRSSAKNPSFPSLHPVCSAFPSAFTSNITPDETDVVCTPSPFRSNISGVLFRFTLTPLSTNTCVFAVVFV